MLIRLIAESLDPLVVACGCGDEVVEPGREATLWDERAARHRYGQLLRAEERLRPLRDTRYAHVYGWVRDHRVRLGRAIVQASRDRAPEPRNFSK